MTFFSFERLLPGEVSPFWQYEKRDFEGLCIHDVGFTILNRRLWLSWATVPPTTS